jgi:hypothetical protein
VRRFLAAWSVLPLALADATMRPTAARRLRSEMSAEARSALYRNTDFNA